jgi:hypothetical protein
MNETERQRKRDQLLLDLAALHQSGLLVQDTWRRLRDQVFRGQFETAEQVVADHIPAGWDMGRVVSYVGAVDEIFPTRGVDIFRAFKPFFASDFKFELKPALPAEMFAAALKMLNGKIGEGADDSTYNPLVFRDVQVITPDSPDWEQPREVDVYEMIAGLSFEQVWLRLLPGKDARMFEVISGLYFDHFVKSQDCSCQAFEKFSERLSATRFAWEVALRLKFASLLIQRTDVAAKAEVILELCLAGNFVAGYRYVKGRPGISLIVFADSK